MAKQENVLISIEISAVFGAFLTVLWLSILGTFIGLGASEVIVDPLTLLPGNETITFEMGDPEYLDQEALLFESMFRMEVSFMEVDK